jgi:hypothetical protein
VPFTTSKPNPTNKTGIAQFEQEMTDGGGGQRTILSLFPIPYSLFPIP